MPTSPRIAVVDYGAGNLRSVAKALERSALAVEVTSDAAALAHYDAIVLPGVGAFADAMASLRAKGIGDAVAAAIARGTPYLGLCLGLQLLFESSDEHGMTAGLGVLRGRVERFPANHALHVPHIGWNQVRWCGTHPVVAKLPRADAYYYVHSYRVVGADAANVAGVTDYGGEFTCAVARGNVFAVQFHPEKSQGAGKRVLDAFAAWVRG
ncbi:MAG: imidazole glycerol phosphate synthase subunit HisH [Deltaproteobacteria bacterium]|nr:imidazole glycerol phosphate synthase subunit HisH [Deltaproteobacteria bacterium]